MKLRSFAVTLAAATLVFSLGSTGPETASAGPIDLSIQLSGYLPAPPGVTVRFEAGRPYYTESNRRVYLKQKTKGDKGKHKGHDKGRKKGHGRD